MKKFLLAFAALSALLLASCLTIQTSKVDADGKTSVKGVLHQDGQYYYIAVGDASIGSNVFYFVKSDDVPEAWKVLTSSVEKGISVEGIVVKYYDDGTRDIAVTEVRQWEQP